MAPSDNQPDSAAAVHHGGCHCGRIRFRVEGGLEPVLACHCSDCLKTVGNSMAATAASVERITISGDGLSWYRSSDKAERGFCQHCGANMFYRGDGRPTLSIAAGMLDDPSVLRFGGHLFLAAHPGHQPLEEAPLDIHENYYSHGRGARRSDDG